jgi:hypothetical protein
MPHNPEWQPLYLKLATNPQHSLLMRWSIICQLKFFFVDLIDAIYVISNEDSNLSHSTKIPKS